MGFRGLAFIEEMGYFCCRCGNHQRVDNPSYTQLETLQAMGYFRDLKEIKKPSNPKPFKKGDFICPSCVKGAKDEAASNKRPKRRVSFQGHPNDRNNDLEIEKLKKVRFPLAACLFGSRS